MMAQLIAAAKCAPVDTVYGGGDVVTGCLPSTGVDLLPLFLLAVGLVMAGAGMRLLASDRDRLDRATEAARRGHPL